MEPEIINTEIRFLLRIKKEKENKGTKKQFFQIKKNKRK